MRQGIVEKFLWFRISFLSAVGLWPLLVDRQYVYKQPSSKIKRETITTKDKSLKVSYIYNQTANPNHKKIIYIHGSPSKAHDWLHFIEYPVSNTFPIAIDRPGYGLTQPNYIETDFARQALAVEPFLTENGAGKPIVVGHSLGGPIATRVAADYADKVGGLLLGGAAMDPDLEEIFYVQRWADKLGAWLPRKLRVPNTELLKTPEELKKLQKVLKKIECPVVIMHGDHDRLVSFKNVDYMHKHIAKKHVKATVTLRGEDHLFIWTKNVPKVEAAISALAAYKECSGLIIISQ